MNRRGSFLAIAAGLGFALFAWVASAGSLHMLGTPTVTASPPQLPPPSIQARPEQISPADGTQTPTGYQGTDLAWIGQLVLTVLIGSAAVIGLVLLARWIWRRRWHRPSALADDLFDALPDVSLALAKDAEAAFAALQEGSPRNAIVACWLRLEEAAGQAGVPRHPAETSAEFTARVLGTLSFDPAMINGFARLYREARFSRHELGEPARTAAVAALHSLYDDIAAADISIPPDLSGVGGHGVREHGESGGHGVNESGGHSELGGHRKGAP